MEKLGLLGNARVYYILGAIFFLVSLGYLFAPGVISKVNQIGKKILFRDEWSFTHRATTGGFFLIVGLLFLYVSFRLKR